MGTHDQRIVLAIRPIHLSMSANDQFKDIGGVPKTEVNSTPVWPSRPHHRHMPAALQRRLAEVGKRLTKRQKLMRFADIVRSRARCPLYLFNNIEYLDRGQWKYISHPASAFALAARDKVLRNAGLEDSSVADAQQFFDLSREELTEFSCVCGGSINKNKMPSALSASPPQRHMTALIQTSS
jgi:hypothetical protein